MGASPGSEDFAPGQSVCVSHEVIPGAGEDSFALQTDGRGGYLCVADGCGGLGSKRYAALGDCTGAFLAACLATRVAERHLEGLFPLPATPEAGRALCAALAEKFSATLRHFEAEHGEEGRVRIVGRMQRALPTTLCMLLMENTALGLDCLFLWAGDSRGYLLERGGLHQLTADHTTLRGDPMESLYRDAPLSNMLNGEEAFFLSGRRVRLKGPCVALVATDGAYGCLRTPMEMEWLLLWTLHKAPDLEGWKRRLHSRLARMASDDCTLQLVLYGYGSFEELKASMEERRLALQRLYITPVRRRKADLDFARDRWRAYQPGYDWTERTGQGEPDWRV